jgi:hypothetical protein
MDRIKQLQNCLVNNKLYSKPETYRYSMCARYVIAEILGEKIQLFTDREIIKAGIHAVAD